MRWNGYARLSDDEVYRYELGGDIGPDEPLLSVTRRLKIILWLMLNPSTADGTHDDQTLLTIVDFSERWGYNRILVGNLYAFRTKHPRVMFAAMKRGVDVVGPMNNIHLIQMVVRARHTGGRVMAAWGKHGRPDRVREVQEIAGELYCLRVNGDGSPIHPLYQPRNLEPTVARDGRMKIRDHIENAVDFAVHTRGGYFLTLSVFAVIVPGVVALAIGSLSMGAGVLATLSGCMVPVVMLCRRDVVALQKLHQRTQASQSFGGQFHDLPEYLEKMPVEDWRPPRPFGGPDAPWEPTALGMQSTFGDSRTEAAYDETHGVRSRHYLTIVRPEDAAWIIERLGDRIAGKVVVEIGAGIGVLAVALAKKARHVYAIESSPSWGAVFARYMYRNKPANLTWILDRAENLVELVRADIAIVVTGSDEDNLRKLARRFAPDVCLPWQDWNGGKAVIKGWGHGTPVVPS